MNRDALISALAAALAHAFALFGFQVNSATQPPIPKEKEYVEVTLTTAEAVESSLDQGQPQALAPLPAPAPVVEQPTPPQEVIPEPVPVPQEVKPEPLPEPEPEPEPEQQKIEQEPPPLPPEKVEVPEPVVEPKPVPVVPPPVQEPPKPQVLPQPEAPRTIAVASNNSTTSSASAQPVSNAAVMGPNRSGTGTGSLASQPYPLRQISPEYPSQCRKLGQQGTVTLRLFISENGRIDNVEIKSSSGFALLDEAAIKAVKRTRFRPAYDHNKRPIASVAEVPYEFILK